MDIEELKKKLLESTIDPRIYSFRGGLDEEKVTIEREPRGWSVYYVERGEKKQQQFFKTEDEACRHMLAWVTKLNAL